MDTPRRFDDREIALIFEQANGAQEAHTDVASRSGGLTLEQLHEIGRDVGLSTDHITRAANAIARGDMVPTQRRTWLGLPVAISRTVDFGRPVSDDEWHGLVSTLRETFEARGKLSTEGAFRHWHNGNLSAMLEPTPTGHRLRLSTRKGDARVRVTMGALYLSLGVGFGALAVLGVVSDKGFVGGGLMAVMGLVALASTYIGLPRWARARAEQMEFIAKHSVEPTS